MNRVPGRERARALTSIRQSAAVQSYWCRYWETHFAPMYEVRTYPASRGRPRQELHLYGPVKPIVIPRQLKKE